MTGLHLAQYRIDTELGRGGMGIVYRATDTKLNRPVALKVLPAAALSSEDDRARFFREAQAAAQLHHPNIATVFGIDEAVPVSADGRPVEGQSEKRPFIAMEFIEGETLQEHAKKGPLRLPEAVSIAMQVAEALKAAHTKNIVHRDIKGANVMLTPDGVAKVLDFGLAKTNQSTMLTRMGSTLGTVAYMSPEQARGQEVDGRTDLWALGVMLYEMIVGRLPFAADYEQATLYSILNEDPEPLTSLRTGVPMELERIVGKLMAKEASRRYPSAAAVLVDLVDVAGILGSGTRSRSSLRPVPTTGAARSSKWLDSRLAAEVLIGALLLSLALWLARSGATNDDARPVRLSQIVSGTRPPAAVAISADGAYLAYVTDVVHVVDLSSGHSTRLERTEGTGHLEFSPDGSQLLLTKSLSIERVPTAGGTPLEVVKTREGNPRATWGPDGWIVHEEIGGMWRYSESRTEAVRLTQDDSLHPGLDYDFPSMLPDGKTILATREAIGSPARTALIDFETGALIDTLSFPAYGIKYLPTGHLVGYVPGEGLVVVPFDLDERRIVGDRQLVAPLSSATRFAVSPTGTLIYVPDADSENDSVPMSIPLLAPFDGVPSPIGLPAGHYSEMRISPQEDRLAFFEESLDGAGRAVRSLKVFDLRRRTTTELVAPISTISELAWLPGGDSVAYFRTPFGTTNYELTGMPADGSGIEQRLTRFGRINCGAVTDLDVSPEGSFYVCGSPAGPNATRLFRIGRREGEFAQLTGRDRQGLDARDPRISPDGRFVAYTQNGRAVVGLSNGEGPARTLMSRGEARFVRWAGDSRRLLYVGIPPQGEVRMRTIDDDGVLASGENTDSTTNIIGQIDPRSPYFEPFASGLAAIVPQIVDEPDSTGRFVSEVREIKVVLGWFRELRSGSN